jgi:DNA-binding IclR family transcriptional regulator
MSQYDIGSLVFDAGDNGITADEIIRKTGLVESTCRTSLIKLEQKDIVKRDGSRYYPDPDATEDDLERIRPRTISELKDDS